jgi:hypothetical protein
MRNLLKTYTGPIEELLESPSEHLLLRLEYLGYAAAITGILQFVSTFDKRHRFLADLLNLAD